MSGENDRFPNSKLSWPTLLLIFALPSAATWADPDCTEPKVMNNGQLENKINNKLDGCQLSESVNITACSKALEEARKAMRDFRSRMQDPCAEIDRSSKTACPPDQKECFSGTSESRKAAAAKLRAVAAALEKQRQALKKPKDELFQSIKEGGELSKTGDNDHHVHSFHGEYLEKKDTPQIKQAGESFASQNKNASTISGTIPEETSKILNEQTEAAQAIVAFSNQISGEIQRLNALATNLDSSGKSLDTRADKQDSYAKTAKAEDKNSSPESSQSTPQMPSGQPAGGQSGGQSGGEGGQGDGSQSSITDPLKQGGSATSPTPDGNNNSRKNLDTSSTGKTGNSGNNSERKTGVADSTMLSKTSKSGAQDKSLSIPSSPNTVDGKTNEKKPADARDLSTSRIRDLNLRAGLGGAGSGGSGGTGASTGTKADGKPGSNAAGGRGTSSSAEFSEEGGDEALSSFGKSLGSSKFSMEGSETDASVKKMLGEFNGENPDEEKSGDQASKEGEGIGGKDSESLFQRVHAFHERCAQKSCVGVFGNRRVEGG